MSEQQPEYVWAYPEEKRRGGRGWLIGALIVAAVAIAVGAFLLIVRPWAAAEPAPTPTASVSTTPSATPSETPTPTPTPTLTPTPTPTPTQSEPPAPQPTAAPPAPGDPDLPVFRGKVQPLLDDAGTGLSYASDADAQEGMQIVDQLRGDAGRMAEAVAPRSIASDWGRAVNGYGAALSSLRKAFETGSPTAGPLASARSALGELQDLVDG